MLFEGRRGCLGNLCKNYADFNCVIIRSTDDQTVLPDLLFDSGELPSDGMAVFLFCRRIQTEISFFAIYHIEIEYVKGGV